MKICKTGCIVLTDEGITMVDFTFEMTEAEKNLTDEELNEIAKPLCLAWAIELLIIEYTKHQESIDPEGKFAHIQTPSPRGDLH